jgi:hypothetical protein
VLINLAILRFRPFICSSVFAWVAIATGKLTGIMAGKICADVVFYDDYYNDVKRKNYF